MHGFPHGDLLLNICLHIWCQKLRPIARRICLMQCEVDFAIGFPFEGACLGVDFLWKLYQTLVEMHIGLVILAIGNALLLKAYGRHGNLLLLYFHFLLICDTAVQIIKVVLHAQ